MRAFFTRGLQSVPMSILLLLTITICHCCHQALAMHISGSGSFHMIRKRNPDTCQCECCYKVGAQMHTECVPSDFTTFDIPDCTDCTVPSCIQKFPISCNQTSSVVNAMCSVRQSWLLQMVPSLFILISACLLVYGCFFKKYDGYHPISHSEPVTRNRPNPDFSTARSVNTQPRSTTPTLPTISETQELIEPSQL